MSLNIVNTATAYSMQENKLAVTTVQAADTLSGNVTFTITGGADQAKFTVDANTGALAFASAPDYDVPGDANADNVYEVEVTATTDSDGSTALQAMAVTITATTDALEKSLDLAHIAAEKIAENKLAIEAEKVRNDDQDTLIAGKADKTYVGTQLDTKADQSDVATLQNTVSTKADQSSLDNTNISVTNNANAISELQNHFTDGVMKLDSLPEELRSGLRPQGTYTPGTTALPVTNADTIKDQEFKYWVVTDFGQADLSLAQDGSNLVDVVPKSWIIGNGESWAVVGGGDGLATVNNKAPVNGNVTLTANDTGYNPSEASGLTATTAKGGIDEVGVKVKELQGSIGDASAYDPVATFNDAYSARIAQG